MYSIKTLNQNFQPSQLNLFTNSDRIRFLSGLEVIIQECEYKNKFQCFSCKKTYKNKICLTRHQRFECGNKKPFSCALCNYSSNQKFQVKIHMARKHSESMGLPQQFMWIFGKYVLTFRLHFTMEMFVLWLCLAVFILPDTNSGAAPGLFWRGRKIIKFRNTPGSLGACNDTDTLIISRWVSMWVQYLADCRLHDWTLLSIDVVSLSVSESVKTAVVVRKICSTHR